MKTLVIHPNDPTTDFLCEVYKDLDCTVIRDDFKNINTELKKYDRIIMLGHGNHDGLIYNGEIIKLNTYTLYNKFCVCVWCNSNEYFKYNKLSGFYSDMVISEYSEALDYCINCNIDDIKKSNKLLASSLKKSINSISIIYEFNKYYNDINNNVIMFNKKNFHQNENYINITELDYKAYECYLDNLKTGIDYGGTIPISLKFFKKCSETESFNVFYKKANIMLRKDKINKLKVKK